MLRHGWSVPFATAVVFVSLVVGCGEDPAQVYDLASINFETTTVPAGGAGQLYNTVIRFTSTGGAALPDQFEVDVGVLPSGVELSRDREDADFDGLPDEHGAYTGHARLLGFPREAGTYLFVIKAISTGEMAGLAQNGDLPALAASAEFTVTIGEGSVSIVLKRPWRPPYALFLFWPQSRSFSAYSRLFRLSCLFERHAQHEWLHEFLQGRPFFLRKMNLQRRPWNMVFPGRLNGKLSHVSFQQQ